MERFKLDNLDSQAYRRVIYESNTHVVNTLKETDVCRLFSVLSASRRVFGVLDGATRPSLINAKRSIHSFIPDISFDLENFQGILVSDEEIARNLAVITSLQENFIPLRDYHARVVNSRYRFADLSEVASVAASVVEQAVWHIFAPSQTEKIDEIAYSLGLCVGSVLKHLPHYVRREMYGDYSLAQRLNSVRFSLYEDESPLEQLMNYETRATSQSRRDSLSEWYDNVFQRGYDLAHIFELVHQLGDVRMQRALLYYFGYLSKEELAKEIFESGLIKRDIIRGLDALNKKAAVVNLQTDLKVDVVNLVRQAREYRDILDSSGNIVKFSARRSAIDHSLITSKPRSPQAMQVLRLAIQKENGRFKYSYAEIAAMVDLTISAIEHIIQRALEQPVYFNTEGHAISEVSNHAWLIVNRPKFTPLQLAALTPLQRVVLDTVTSPTADGAYPHEKKAQELLEFKRSGMMGTIRKCLEDGHVVVQTITDIKLALSLPAKFSNEEHEFLRYVEDEICRGRPVRNDGKGIRWAQLIDDFRMKTGFVVRPHFPAVVKTRLADKPNL